MGPDIKKRSKLQQRRKRLLIVAGVVVVLIGATAATYIYISGAPQRADAEFQAGMKFMEPGRFQEAIPKFTRAIQIHELDNAYLERGLAHLILHEDDLAVADLEKALDLNPNIARAHSGLGTIYRQRGDNKRAIDEYTKSIAISSNVDALFERGQLYESLGEHQKAIDDFTAAIDALRDAPYIYRARAMAKRNLGDEAGYAADRDQARSIEYHQP